MDITINKNEKEKFGAIIALYPKHNYAQVDETEDTITLNVLGEDIEGDSDFLEFLMERLSYVNIEEEIGD